MSFRLYPQFVKGNPQLRVFLPNFWMKLVKPKSDIPPNVAQFIVPVEMSGEDVKNYLEKIYDVPVTQVKVRVESGEVRRNFKKYLVKDDDYKVAYVTLAKNIFEFPNLFPESKKEEAKKDQERLENQAKSLVKQRNRNWTRSDVSGWFEI